MSINAYKTAGVDLDPLKKYSDIKKLAKQNVKCFLETLMLYSHDLPRIVVPVPELVTGLVSMRYRGYH